MIILYNTGIQIMILIFRIAAHFHLKANEAIKGRKNWKQKITNALKNNQHNIVWFHISSLGEFEQARPLIIKLKSQFPHYKILITFFSPSGFNAQKNFEYADWVFYLPFDTPHNAKTFLDIVKPKFIFFIKYEFWINFLFEIQKRKKNNEIKCFLISSIFRKHQPFFKWYGKIFKNALNAFDIIFIQDNLSLKLLKKLNLSNTILPSGDTRIDRVIEIKQQNISFEDVKNFCNHSKIIICGSTWPQDEKIIIPAFQQLLQQHTVKMIIAPHQPDKKNLDKLINLLHQYQLSYITYSKLKNITSFETPSILVIDTIGLLKHLYKYGHIAYIGGGFSDGIHNILEPAAFGIPIIFGGKKYTKFYEATEMLQNKAAFNVLNHQELFKQLNALLLDNDLYSKTSNAVSQFIFQNQGAVNKTFETIKKYLDKTNYNP